MDRVLCAFEDYPMRKVPPQLYFVGSAVFHYLGPAFAVLLFARVEPLGVAWLRIASAALVFALWRRPWRVWRELDGRTRRLLCALAAVLAVMNSCFYLAVDRLPLGTVAAVEFLPVIAVAALGTRTGRNAVALVLAVAGVAALSDVRLVAEPLGFAFAAANAVLFALYIVLGHRVAQAPAVRGIDGLALAMLIAAVVALPLGVADAAPAFVDPVLLAAGVGVGVTSSVVPYVCDQLAMARLTRSAYALMVALLPATATVIGVVVLRQIPTLVEVLGVGLVVAGVALHREGTQDAKRRARTWRARRSSSGGLPADAAAAVRPGHDRDTDRCHDDLHDELQPVDAAGLGRNAKGTCDERADERCDDTDDDGQPDRDGLPARHDQPTKSADDGTDDDRGNDARDGHGVLQ
jgi:inner membrane transporter RhtA